MASTGKASIKLASSQTLTGSYAVTDIPSYSIKEESIGSFEIQYTTGAAEAGSALNFLIEFSYDGTNWVGENYGSFSSGVNTLATQTNKVAGGAGSTTYTAEYFVPLCHQQVRVRVKETGVGANYGTVTIIFTVASGSGQQRTFTPSSGSGTTDVNLTQVGGAAVTLGQKTMANSIPVVISSDQTIVATSAKQDTGNTSLATIAGAVSGTEMQADIVAALPAGTNLLGRVSSSLETSTIYSGTTAKTPAYAFANVAASQTDSSLVASPGAVKIRVLSVYAVAGGTATTLTFNSKGGGAGTAISALFANAANGGEILPFSPVGWFETSTSEALTVTTGAGSTTGIGVVYITI